MLILTVPVLFPCQLTNLNTSNVNVNLNKLLFSSLL